MMDKSFGGMPVLLSEIQTGGVGITVKFRDGEWWAILPTLGASVPAMSVAPTHEVKLFEYLAALKVYFPERPGNIKASPEMDRGVETMPVR